MSQLDLAEIRHLRLLSQQLLNPNAETAEQVVAHFGAMQAQEYAMAKWAIGLRAPSLLNTDVEAAFQKSKILRTHLLRPTWHFVVPEDIRSLLKLTASHVHKKNSYMYRQTDLDETILKKTCSILEQSLSANQFLTRNELAEHLAASGIIASGQRLAYVMMYAELEEIICSGPRIGKQFSYQLLDNVCPKIIFNKEQSLAKLAVRYFTSRGPATSHDFANWSGLTMKEARFAVESLPNHFDSFSYNQKSYYYLPQKQANPTHSATFLLPDYDEYGMSYKDRSVLSPRSAPTVQPSDRSHWLVVNGRIEGTWEITSTDRTTVITKPYFKLPIESQKAVELTCLHHQQFWST